MDAVQRLLEILDLERLEVDLFRGHSPDTHVQRVFGGQVIGQALVAAYRTVKERNCHSLHAYFLRPGDPHVPIIYQVERMRDGRSFTTRRVAAIQHGKQIFALTANFQIEEEGFTHQIKMPDVPGPDEMPITWCNVPDILASRGMTLSGDLKEFLATKSVEFRLPDIVVDEPKPHENYVWFKAVKPLEVDPIVHQCVLAYASDMTLLDSSVRPHGVSWAARTVQMASLDHAMWFHAPVKADEWLLYVKDSPFSGGARGFTRGNIFDQSGTLVASVTQEGLIRPQKVEDKA